MKLNTKIIFLSIIAVFLFVNIVKLNSADAQSVKGASIKYDAKKTTLYTPKIDSIKDTLTLAGSISTDQIAAVRFKNSGRLNWVGVKVGDRVRKGQVIATLDAVELRKNLQTQFNNYKTQLSQFDDTNDNYKSAKDNLLVTDTIKRILDRTQNSLNNSVINYEIADMAVKESVLSSPIDGIVVAIDQPFAGSYITPASATFTIINPNNLYFKANVDQEAVTKIKLNEPVKLKLDSFTDKVFDSKVSYIAFTPVASETSTVYETRFILPVDNQDLSYRIGMDGDVTIILSQADNTLTVPTDAINDDNGQSYVYIKKDNTLIRKNVSIGIQNDTTTQVTEGLTSNDQVAVIQK